ncbi:MAG: hypothetical protein L3J68_04565 [Thermoplasmata archaeon]|nr:hypothetical protein [Thermoplasmata archaeon]
MTLRRRETELSLERPLGPDGPSGGVVRLTVRLDSGPSGEAPSPSELSEALDHLKADLDALVGAPLAALPANRADRELAELIGTYRPRQRELVDLLRDEGEITPNEHGRLVEYLSASASSSPSSPAAPVRVEPRFDQPIAAVPIAADRLPEPTRPIAELLRQYQITSLKQAGAVRARRQISFEEYMSLKRHFQPTEAVVSDRST